MLKNAKSLKRSCVMHERKYVFISLILEKLRSSDATDTGNVRNNDEAVTKSGKLDVKSALKHNRTY